MFSCLNTVCLKATDQLKLSIFSCSFKIIVSKVQDFGNFELSPMMLLSLHGGKFCMLFVFCSLSGHP